MSKIELKSKAYDTLVAIEELQAQYNQKLEALKRELAEINKAIANFKEGEEPSSP